MNAPTLVVYLHDHPVGELRDDERGLTFQYRQEWCGRADARPVSLSLPLRDEPFDERECRPYFANLLPDADVRRRLAALLGLSAQNDFALLREVGGDCAGAVSLFPPADAPVQSGSYRELDDATLSRLLAALPERPLIADEDGVRLSLAGAQDKLPVRIDEGNVVSLPLGSYASSHILKPSHREFKDVVANEFFCMRLARLIGLPVPAAGVRPLDGGVYQVERYDRRRAEHAGPSPIRLHQEDFCQALRVLPDRKYEAEGGPGLAACFQLLAERSIDPAGDRLHLLRWSVFNLVIGNADAHAKNLSLLLDTGPRLAPFYDLLCTAIYPGLSKHCAMAIGGKRLWSHVHGGRWSKLAAEAGMNARLVRREVGAVVAAIQHHAPVVAESAQLEHGSEVYALILAEIARRAGLLAARLRVDED
jgi:serine/threonine-protein kinase HipA